MIFDLLPIAIIDAYAHPNAESDLAVFTNRYGLPSCTTSNGCFTRVGQTGTNTYPPNQNASWALEANLDIQWVHSIAPGANILYVEADTDDYNDLFTAVKYV